MKNEKKEVSNTPIAQSHSSERNTIEHFLVSRVKKIEELLRSNDETDELANVLQKSWVVEIDQ